MRLALTTNNGHEFIAEAVIKQSKISIIMEKDHLNTVVGVMVWPILIYN